MQFDQCRVCGFRVGRFVLEAAFRPFWLMSGFKTVGLSFTTHFVVPIFSGFPVSIQLWKNLRRIFLLLFTSPHGKSCSWFVFSPSLGLTDIYDDGTP